MKPGREHSGRLGPNCELPSHSVDQLQTGRWSSETTAVFDFNHKTDLHTVRFYLASLKGSHSDFLMGSILEEVVEELQHEDNSAALLTYKDHKFTGTV